jgi:hypothetical protein
MALRGSTTTNSHPLRVLLYKYKYVEFKCCRTTLSPGIMHANQESRDCGLEYYELCWENSQWVIDPKLKLTVAFYKSNAFWINFAVDRLFLKQDLGILNHLRAVMNWLLGSCGRPCAPGEALGGM